MDDGGRRSVNQGAGGWYCDHSGCDKYDCYALGAGTGSRDWQGENWYRFVGTSGDKMPDYPVSSHRCQTVEGGWLNANHPNSTGQTIESAKVCFSFRGTCSSSTYIKITNCGNVTQ